MLDCANCLSAPDDYKDPNDQEILDAEEVCCCDDEDDGFMEVDLTVD